MRNIIAAFILLVTSAVAFAQSMTAPVTSPTTFGSPSTTAAGLPPCTAALTNVIYTVTNSLTPALGVAVVGGGAVSVMVRCNGTNWLVGQ